MNRGECSKMLQEFQNRHKVNGHYRYKYVSLSKSGDLSLKGHYNFTQ